MVFKEESWIRDQKFESQCLYIIYIFVPLMLFQMAKNKQTNTANFYFNF